MDNREQIAKVVFETTKKERPGREPQKWEEVTKYNRGRWLRTADWHIAEIEKAKAEVADEIITMIETYDTNDLDTVASLFKYAIALKQQGEMYNKKK